MSLTSIKKLSRYLIVNSGLPLEQEPVFVYAFEVLASNITNIVLSILLGWLFGVLPGTVSCLITIFLFRHTAGGAHCSSPWRCTVITVSVFPLLALLASYFSVKQQYADILTALSLIIGLIAIMRLAPVENKAAPILSELRRKRLKVASLLVLFLIAAIVSIARWSLYVNAKEIQLCVAFSILWVCLMLTSFGHRLLFFVDGVVIPKRREVKT
ncbi:MAG: Accessory gene regulator protein B [Pelotomaculum sp. PtaU1.Bin035]|nr:MAG: Accessory gene regulator protein B [Pelotomaculum sp. PtaU1.Bin035]